jgi:hypothetical protein
LPNPPYFFFLAAGFLVTLAFAFALGAAFFAAGIHTSLLD